MSKNVQITTQARRQLPPLTGGADAVHISHAVVVDEQTYWTGKDYGFIIENRSQFTRWYRVVVTNLQRNDEYVVFTEHGRLDDTRPIELNSGDEVQLSIVFGGESERQPTAPRQFEVYVQEYATPDERGQYKAVLSEKLEWIPRPDQESISITTREASIRVRPWPWTQRVQVHASLLNRSYLPITADVSALPTDAGKEAGLEGTHEALREPIPAQQEQPVLCTITLERRLKAPALLEIDARTEIPALEMKVTTAPRTVEIVPIPFGKIWQDWAALAVIALLLFWASFGIPPTQHVYTQVTLQFDQPIDFDTSSLKVTLEPTGPNAQEFPLKALEGKEEHSGTKALTYTFDWGTPWRGFFLTRKHLDLKLKIEPKANSTAFTSVGNQDKDPKATISTADGVSETNIVVSISLTRISPADIAIPSGTPKAPFTFTVKDSGSSEKITDGASTEGEARVVAIPMRTQTRNVIVDIAVNGKTIYSQPVSLEAGKTANLEKWNSKEQTENIGHGPDPAQAAKEQAAKDQAAKEQAAKDQAAKEQAAKEQAAKNKGGTGGVGPVKIPFQPDPEVEKWCNSMKLRGSIKALTQAKRVANPLTLDVQMAAPDEQGEITITVTANDDCVYQLYDVTQDGQWSPIYGPLDKLTNRPTLHPARKEDARPVALTKGVPKPHTDQMSGGYEIIVAIGYRNKGVDVNKDLVPLLITTDGTDFAIAGAKWPEDKPNGVLK